jgi:starch synthase
MPGNLNILFVSAECVPFAKSGGLGDVTGALPQFLKKKGHNIIVVIPMYSFIDRRLHNIETVFRELQVETVGGDVSCAVQTAFLPCEVQVYFIDYAPFFDRPGLYNDSSHLDYEDNPKRFIFLSKAALELCRALNFAPDIIHANDWHTAMLPAYIKRTYNKNTLFRSAASVLTVHNLAYQGRYDRRFYDYSGLPEEDFIPYGFECYGAVNFLKGGIIHADMVNTVSRGYADETRTVEGGYGLDNFLREKGDRYVGIVNGVDYSVWDPAVDTFIPASYNINDLKGKGVCKRILLERSGLTGDESVPVIGVVSRLVMQKGFYLLAECIDDVINDTDVRFVILGAGDKQLETFYADLQRRHPGRVCTTIGYSNELAHLIEAGSDFFLMPSLYEPCGLNQIYSLKYGTLPVVRATGGLNDTIENYNQTTGEGTGFKFHDPDGAAIYNTIMWAVDTYLNRRNHFLGLIHNAMSQHFSWEDSAANYIEMYYKAQRERQI